MQINFKEMKFYFLVFVICLSIFIYSALNYTDIFDNLFQFLFDPEFKRVWELEDYTFFEYVAVYAKNITDFDMMIVWGTNLFQILIPLFTSVVGVRFYQKLSSSFQFEAYREKTTYKTFLLKKIFKDAILLASTMYLAYLFLYAISFIITNGHLNETGKRGLFSDLNANFFDNSPYFYFLIEGFIRFFIVPIIYTVFTCSTALYAKSQKQVLLGVNIYYFGLASIAFGMSYITHYSWYVNPTSVMLIGGLADISSTLVLLISTIPFWVGIILIHRRGKRVEI